MLSKLNGLHRAGARKFPRRPQMVVEKILLRSPSKPSILEALQYGPVAEPVDARDLKSLEGNFVRVRVPPGPPPS